MIERVARIGASYLSTHGGCRNGAVCRAAAGTTSGTARELSVARRFVRPFSLTSLPAGSAGSDVNE
ncbi:cytidine deaminase, partial [Burkholderia pseudomallei]|nr:cytidine deaminase [Burkholderia pseudomallei]